MPENDQILDIELFSSTTYQTMDYGTVVAKKDEHLTPQNNAEETEDKSRKLRRWGLASGICYAIIIVCGITAEVGIRDNIIDFTSAEATAANIRNHPTALRWSILLEMIMASADIVVSILFTLIFLTAGVGPFWSVLSSGFRVMQQAVITGNLMNIFAASMLLDDTLNQSLPVESEIEAMGGGNANAAQSLAFFFLAMHKYGYLLALIFFSLSLVVLGGVIFAYGVFPKCLGGFILAAGIAYLIDSLLFFLSSGYNGQISPYLMIPVFIAEFGLTGWLLVKTPQMSGATTKAY